MPYSAIRSGDFKLIEFHDDRHVELYDVRADIGESRDLAASHPEKAAQLRARLAAWRSEVVRADARAQSGPRSLTPAIRSQPSPATARRASAAMTPDPEMDNRPMKTRRSFFCVPSCCSPAARAGRTTPGDPSHEMKTSILTLTVFLAALPLMAAESTTRPDRLLMWSSAMLRDAAAWPHSETDARIAVTPHGLRVEVRQDARSPSRPPRISPCRKTWGASASASRRSAAMRAGFSGSTANCVNPADATRWAWRRMKPRSASASSTSTRVCARCPMRRFNCSSAWKAPPAPSRCSRTWISCRPRRAATARRAVSSSPARRTSPPWS